MEISTKTVNASYDFSGQFFDNLISSPSSDVEKTLMILRHKGITLNDLFDIYISNRQLPDFLSKFNELGGRKLFLLLRNGFPQTVLNRPFYWFSKDVLTETCVRVFFNLGINLDVVDPKSGDTLLTNALKQRNSDLVYLLLKARADPNFNDANAIATRMKSSQLTLAIYGGDSLPSQIEDTAELLTPDYFEVSYYEDAVEAEENSAYFRLFPSELETINSLPDQLQQLYNQSVTRKTVKSIQTQSGTRLEWPHFLDASHLFNTECVLPPTVVEANSPGEYVGETLEEEIMKPTTPRARTVKFLSGVPQGEHYSTVSSL